MASAGKEYLLWLTTNGLAGGTQVAVAYQGDMDFDTGKDLDTTMFKQDMAYTAQTTSGVKMGFDMLVAEPLGIAAALLMDAHDNATEVYGFFQTPLTGGQRWSGKFKVAMTNLPAPVSGPALYKVKLAQSNTITRVTV